jgi:hypothetical protein
VPMPLARPRARRQPAEVHSELSEAGGIAELDLAPLQARLVDGGG